MGRGVHPTADRRTDTANELLSHKTHLRMMKEKQKEGKKEGHLAPRQQPAQSEIPRKKTAKLDPPQGGPGPITPSQWEKGVGFWNKGNQGGEKGPIRCPLWQKKN